MENIYDKLDASVDRIELLRTALSDLGGALDDAKNQAENGSELGMAFAVGRANRALSDVNSMLDSILRK